MATEASNALEKIAAFLAKQADIRLGLVFGSLASGHARRDSDLNIAVLGERALNADRRIQIIGELARISDRV